MQSSDSERTQSIAMTRNTAIKRKNDCEEHILSKQTAHGHSRISEEVETREGNSPVKTLKRDLVQKGTLPTSPPTNNTRICKFEALLCRSHSIDDSIIQTMSSTEKMPKATIINDSIHGHINFGPHAMAIIDTPQFQRLRNIKQVGSCHWVYPNATHSRFQHSLGVAYLARKFVDHLRYQYPNLVDDVDVKCVELAGLCHDLGHGPYSHLWEGFVHEAEPDSKWHHEDNSIAMLDYLIEDNNLKSVLLQEEITKQDILFIKEMIAGYIDPVTGLPSNPKEILNGDCKDDNITDKWVYRGRPEEKAFLYEIVANKISGIDVDKWDYFLRDKEYLKVNTVFDYQRFIMYSRIIKTGNPLRPKLCIRDKEAENLLDMFQDRARLHRQGYQHRVVKIIDRMLVDAFLAANNYIFVKGRNGKSYKLSEACSDIVAYEKLTDSVFDKILDSDCEEAKNILRRVQKRQFYKSIAEIRPSKDHELFTKNASDIENDLKAFIPEKNKQLTGGSSLALNGTTQTSCDILSSEVQGHLQKEEILVIIRRVTMGMGSRNPIEKVTFYSKHGKQENLSQIDSRNMNYSLPDHILGPTIWICCKRNEALALTEAKAAVKGWAIQKNIQIDFH